MDTSNRIGFTEKRTINDKDNLKMELKVTNYDMFKDYMIKDIC